MSSGLKKTGCWVCCLCLLLAGLAATAIGEERASILCRLQVVDAPELGELIRIGLANLPEVQELARLIDRGGVRMKEYNALKKVEEGAKAKLVRSVTEAYAQLKLLDTQIQQIDKKISLSSRTEGIKAELILARAELEAKRTMKLAELREIMNIVPKHAFGRQAVASLKNWLVLDVMGNSVYVLKFRRPYREWKRYPDYAHVVKVMSAETAVKYIKDLVKNREELPLRVTIFRTESGIKVSEKLYEQVIETIRKGKAELETDVYLAEVRGDIDTSDYFLRAGKIYDGEWYMRRQTRHKDEQRFFEKDIEWYLTRPRSLPRKFIIKFDAESKDLALRMVDAIKAKAKDLGVERFVEIEQEETEFEVPGEEEEKDKPRGMRGRTKR